MKKLFQNKHGAIRSGWVILLCLVASDLVYYALSEGVIFLLRSILRATGDIDPITGAVSPLVDWLNQAFLPIALYILLELTMIAVALLTWKILRRKWADMGLQGFRTRFPREGGTGMALGIVCCTAIFVILLLSGSAVVTSGPLLPSPAWLWWILVFVLVGIGEEVMYRGLVMSALRQTNNVFLILIVPSVVFGLIHLNNPGVTLLSILNIILFGIAFSWMYYRSGNLWMCIGYHITWNFFQACVYGMPVSGVTHIESILITEYPTANLLNGGAFGIEGGLLTTAFCLVLVAFTELYYRKSKYRFLSPEDPATK